MALAAAATLSEGCGGPPCRSPDDCPLGSYCVLRVGEGASSGECIEDCFEATDCPAPASAASRAICTNEGRCRTVARAPRLRLRLPEADTVLDEGTRAIQVSGEVESAAQQVQVDVAAVGSGGCAGGPPVRLRLDNPSGEFRTLPFSVDPFPVEAGTRAVQVQASVGGASRQTEVALSVLCPGCAEVSINTPSANAPVPQLELPALEGTVSPDSVPLALWRVRGGLGGVFDGAIVVGSGGRFRLERLPLFAGTNQVEILVSGVGSGSGQVRCSTYVQAAGRERGLRAVMTWDEDLVDLDLHLIGPGGRFGVPQQDLSARTPPAFGGRVLDDFDGLGPEVLEVEELPDGVYGLIVEPLVGRASALLRLLGDGIALTTGPVGPRFVDAESGGLWVAGTLTVTGGALVWRSLDDVVPVQAPPLNGPELWPAYR